MTVKPTLLDFIVIFIFVFAGVIFSLQLLSYKDIKDKSFVVIAQNNKVIYRDEISKDQLIKLDGAIVEIKGNRIRIKESNCPFKICVRSGWIQEKNQQIICVPNKIYIKLVSADTKIDSVTY